MSAPDPERLADAVLRVDDVDSLYGGLGGEVATYLPGKRVPGVRVRDGRVEIHIVVAGHRPVTDTARDVRRAVSPQVQSLPVDVIVGDIVESAPRPRSGPSLPA